jgi:hypothetical protein
MKYPAELYRRRPQMDAAARFQKMLLAPFVPEQML